jgi:hypothetical protein
MRWTLIVPVWVAFAVDVIFLARDRQAESLFHASDITEVRHDSSSHRRRSGRRGRGTVP